MLWLERHALRGGKSFVQERHFDQRDGVAQMTALKACRLGEFSECCDGLTVVDRALFAVRAPLKRLENWKACHDGLDFLKINAT